MSRQPGLSSASLALRSVLWAMLLPGVVAGYVPWRYFGLHDVVLKWSDARVWAGVACAMAGALLLCACIVEFARRGQGTLSPVDAPRHLVIGGLYRYVRNPMYLSVTMIVLGEAVLARSQSLAVYWAVFFSLANVFVIGYEERALRHQFGKSYNDYAAHVHRWIPTVPPSRS